MDFKHHEEVLEVGLAGRHLGRASDYAWQFLHNEKQVSIRHLSGHASGCRSNLESRN